jgi:hypothetical protein
VINLSCVNVNSIICVEKSGVGNSGHVCSIVTPCM